MVKKREILKSDVRADQILNAAVKVARRSGWESMTRDVVAEEASCGVGTVNNMYGTMTQLRRSVMRRVVDLIVAGDHEDDLLIIVAKGMAGAYVEALKAPSEVKQLAFELMSRG